MARSRALFNCSLQVFSSVVQPFDLLYFEYRHAVCRATIRSYNTTIIDNAIHAVRATVIAIVNIASVLSFPGP